MFSTIATRTIHVEGHLHLHYRKHLERDLVLAVLGACVWGNSQGLLHEVVWLVSVK